MAEEEASAGENTPGAATEGDGADDADDAVAAPGPATDGGGEDGGGEGEPAAAAATSSFRRLPAAALLGRLLVAGE